MNSKILIIFLCIISISLIGCSKINTNNEQEFNSEMLTGEIFFKELEIDSIDRRYGIYIPTNYSKNNLYPIVFLFHGGGGNALQFESTINYTNLAEKEKIILIYPQGSGYLSKEKLLTYNANFCCGSSLQRDINETKFILKIIEEINSTYSINSKKIYATGFSNGAIMSHQIGIELSNIFTAIAPVSSQIGGQATSNSNFWTPKKNPTNKISVLIINGLEDENVPYFGGKPITKTHVYQWNSTNDSMNYWTNANNCKNTSSIININNLATKTTFCNNQTYSVELITIKDGTHSWPGGKESREGAAIPSQAISATNVTWEFFKKHSK